MDVFLLETGDTSGKLSLLLIVVGQVGVEVFVEICRAQ